MKRIRIALLCCMLLLFVFISTFAGVTNPDNGLIVDGLILKLNTFEGRITTNATTTPTSATCYISSIVITTEVAGTTSTLTIRDKQGTPVVLVNAMATAAVSLLPSSMSFPVPIKMTSGVDVVTAGVGAATMDVWISYWQ